MSLSKALAPLLPSSRGHYLSPKHLAARDDPRQVVSDPRARYYGVEVSERTLFLRMTRNSVKRMLWTGSGRQRVVAATSGWSGGTQSLSVFQETSVNGRQPHLRLGGTYEPEHVGITSW
jgi:hypothetical protein